MGLFSIFKRKPGGTFVGNLLRGVGKAVGGKFGLGQGKMMISQEEYDRKNGKAPAADPGAESEGWLPGSEPQPKQGIVKPSQGTDIGANLGQQLLNTVAGNVLDTPEGQQAAKTAVINKAKSYAVPVIGIAALAFIGYKLMNRK